MCDLEEGSSVCRKLKGGDCVKTSVSGGPVRKDPNKIK